MYARLFSMRAQELQGLLVSIWATVWGGEADFQFTPNPDHPLQCMFAINYRGKLCIVLNYAPFFSK